MNGFASRQAGTVLPVCLLFLFLIAQLALSALETAALNQVMLFNLRLADDIERSYAQAGAHAIHQVQNPDQVLPLQFSGPLATAGEPSYSYLLESVHDLLPVEVPDDTDCVHLHRLQLQVYTLDDRALPPRGYDHYQCCHDASCEKPDLSVWFPAP